METRAYLKGTRLSPQKAGLVANAIRGKSVQEAMDFLIFNKQKGSAIIRKLLESAIANAEHNDGADIDELKVIPDRRNQVEAGVYTTVFNKYKTKEFSEYNINTSYYNRTF